MLLILRLLPGRGTISNPKVPTLTVAWMVVASAEEEGREPKRDHREERRAGKGKFRLEEGGRDLERRRIEQLRFARASFLLLSLFFTSPTVHLVLIDTLLLFYFATLLLCYFTTLLLCYFATRTITIYGKITPPIYHSIKSSHVQ